MEMLCKWTVKDLRVTTQFTENSELEASDDLIRQPVSAPAAPLAASNHSGDSAPSQGPSPPGSP
jgi:hypothetical protein